MITVLAATGFTGRLIAHELHRLHLPMRLAARDPDKLASLVDELGGNIPIVVADVTQPETLPAVFHGTRVLISCAGPFIEMGEPVVAEAVRQGVHYLDTTGEQAFIKLVFERYGVQAGDKGIVLTPGAAFEYALSDAAASIAGRELEPCDEISIIYAVAGFGTSRGTKKSILGVLSGEGYLYREGRLIRAAPGAIHRSVHLPTGEKVTAVSFPGGEVILVPPHVKTRAVIPMMAFSPLAAGCVTVGLPILRSLMRAPGEKLLRRAIDKGSVGPSDTERAGSRFTILCEASRDEDRRAVIAQGRDPYGLTAVIAGSLASYLLTNEPLVSGAVSPAMVAGPEFITGATGEHGVHWIR